MSIALFSADGGMFLLRWLHVLFGITWIGLLYYFNFVQGAFFAEIDGPTKNQALTKLVPRALWYFRYGALVTLLTGIGLITGRAHQGFNFMSSWGVSISVSMTMAFIMFCNVWLVIWPNQKIVIASATQVLGGGQALPEAAGAGAKALLASRTNTLFSIAMLFFMVAARNLNITTEETSNYLGVAIVTGLIILAIELNALKGKLGPIATVKGVVHMGVVLALVMYGIIEFFL
jgi:uncharacterized membrane protein